MQQTFETLHPQAFHPRAALGLPTFSEIEDSIALWSERDPRLAALFAQGAPPVKALRFFGLKRWEEGRNDFAVEVLLAAASLAPGEAVLWNDIAGACYAASRREDAAASMTASLARNGEQPRGWLFLAMIHNDGQEFAAAEQAYLQALALDPGLADASFGLGLLCFRQRRFEEAAVRMRTAISQGNETLAARACLGQALYLLGDFSGAAEAFALQASLSPVDPKIMQKLALCRLIEAVIRGSVGDALAIYRQTAGAHGEDLSKVTRTAFQLLSGYGHREAALKLGTARREWAGEDPVERYLLSALAGDPIERAPDDYLVAHFDGFADGFDQTLVEILDYHVPEKLNALLQATGRRFPKVLELGCGTGLAGPLLRKLSGTMTGIDISPRMLEKARARKLYDHLQIAEAASFLEGMQDRFDLIFGTDLLVYFGDMSALFRHAARSLGENGLFAFNIESTDMADFTVLPTGRFAHRISYVEELARKDFTLVEMVPTTLRLEANRPVAGALFVLRRR